MASIQIQSPLNMHTVSTWYGTIVAHDSSHIQIANGSLVGTYFGSFSYDAQGNVFGTLTGFTQSYTGIPALTITGLNVQAGTVESLVQSNQIQQLFQLALAGNDQFTVTAGLHVIDGYGGSNTVTEPSTYSQYKISTSGSSLILTNANTASSDTLYNIQTVNFSDGSYNVQTGVFKSNTGLLGSLTVSQQLELIYAAYFNRAADGGGNNFWGGQNVQAQIGGQSAATALTNIANSFTPQAETIALYPFLSTPNLNLNTPTAQAGLTAFIGSVYQNMFNRAADTAGQNYWVGQITSGAVGLGAAALAIANGATGSDAIEVQNKITVALDFTTRTTSAGLGQTGPLPAAFLTAARSVLSGVDATSLNDASVTAGESATTNYIANPTSGQSAVLGISAETTTPITISASNSIVDPGVGNYSIQFLAGTAADTLVLHAASLDQVSGFEPSTDVLDLRSLLSGTNVDLNGDIATLSRYVTVVDQGADALVRFDPTGHGGGGAVAVLQGLGSMVTSLDGLVAQGAIRIA